MTNYYDLISTEWRSGSSKVHEHRTTAEKILLLSFSTLFTFFFFFFLLNEAAPLSGSHDHAALCGVPAVFGQCRGRVRRTCRSVKNNKPSPKKKKIRKLRLFFWLPQWPIVASPGACLSKHTSGSPRDQCHLKETSNFFFVLGLRRESPYPRSHHDLGPPFFFFFFFFQTTRVAPSNLIRLLQCNESNII